MHKVERDLHKVAKISTKVKRVPPSGSLEVEEKTPRCLVGETVRRESAQVDKGKISPLHSMERARGEVPCKASASEPKLPPIKEKSVPLVLLCLLKETCS